MKETYVITRELRKHFTTFLNNYEHSIDYPTDKMGVWISGFFGSGKSHFLKILSYLLSNQTVAGKPAIRYFEDKFDDPMMYAQLERCALVPTDTILFNIDSKSPINKDSTAILRVFAKVFYEHQGFYGNDLKVAKLEQFITKKGKMDAFKEEFESINGDTWENARDAFAFWEDDIVDVLQSVLGISETAARNWFNGEETAELTIEQLVTEIRDYVNARGKEYRLLFMIDEVGQYIGSDGSLMLNLQTIVEEIGSKCGGRVWVMVTSQEAIDSITKISGDDFSKIQGRFNTRLMIPQDNIRFKTGGGMNYVHGGVSLQEMMVPVITFKNMRASNKKFVESSKAKVELISSGRKVSNNMFSLNFYQKEAVGGKVAACTYSVFFTDAAGKPISDTKTIIADKTSDNGSERVFRVRFTLKGQEFKKTEEYYLTIMEKDGTGVPEKIAFTIDIAFANDFDF